MPQEMTTISDILDFRQFEWENRRRLGLGFIFALNFMLLLAVLWHPNLRRLNLTEDELYRRLRVDIIEIPSSGGIPGMGESSFSIPSIPENRLPAFKRPATDMHTLLSQLNMRGDEYRAEIERQIRELSAQFARDIALRGTLRDPGFPVPTEDKGGTARQPGNHRYLSSEGLNLADIDSLGIYGGFVIQDPYNRRKVKGFAYLPSLVRGIPASYSAFGNAIPGLIEAMNPCIDIELKLAPPVSLASQTMLRYPVLYIAAAADSVFELNEAEVRRFGEYLRHGGFAILDNGYPWGGFTPVDASFIHLIRKALGSDGRFDPIPPDHDLYHCYFDIPHPLPAGASARAKPVRKNLYEYSVKLTDGKVITELVPQATALPANLWGDLNRDAVIQEMRERMEANCGCLWGVWLGDRLAAVFIDKGYGHIWQEGIPGYRDASSRATMELGVNMMVFALTQKGGISVQYLGR